MHNNKTGNIFGPSLFGVVLVIVYCLVHCRAIMKDVKRDNRVLSLVNKAGLRNQLTTMLDQLQRCQKSLNEFLEVSRSLFPKKTFFVHF